MKLGIDTIVTCYVALIRPAFNIANADTTTPNKIIIAVMSEVRSHTTKYSLNQVGKKNVYGIYKAINTSAAIYSSTIFPLIWARIITLSFAI